MRLRDARSRIFPELIRTLLVPNRPEGAIVDRRGNDPVGASDAPALARRRDVVHHHQQGDRHDPADRSRRHGPRRVALSAHPRGRDHRHRCGPRGLGDGAGAPRRQARHLPRRRHEPVRPGAERLDPARRAQELPRCHGARRRRAGALPARRHDPQHQRAPGPPQPQARPRPGVLARRDDRRRHRRQLVGHELRHPAELVPSSTPPRPAPTSTCTAPSPSCGRAWRPSGTGCAPTPRPSRRSSSSTP